jgi:hypothetical protein
MESRVDNKDKGTLAVMVRCVRLDAHPAHGPYIRRRSQLVQQYRSSTAARFKLDRQRQSNTTMPIHYFSPRSIFLKSSCAFPLPLSSEGICGPAGRVAGGGFRARPNPARGLDAAVRGINAAGVPRGFPETSSPSENRSCVPLNSKGSGFSSNRAASACDWNSTVASCLSSNTSTRFTGASFSMVCWSRPSWVPSGRPRMRSDRLRASAFLPNPVSVSLTWRLRKSDISIRSLKALTVSESAREDRTA